MTIKEAILKSLEALPRPSTHLQVLECIKLNNFYEFEGKTPDATISAQLGEFIRKGDSRVGRYKDGGAYYYFLSNNLAHSAFLDQSSILSNIENDTSIEVKNKKNISNKKSGFEFQERDLHKLFIEYLNSIGIRSKTIFHEKSKNGNDDAQKWIHPDIVSVKFLDFKTEASIRLLKTLDKKDSVNIFSYELKKEISNDYELKKSFFQAVSNSSWANYGYLVAFDFNTSLLYSEMERLNKAFGIGFIKINPDPYLSKEILPAQFRTLDYQTIDKLCNINSDFEKFIENIEKILTAEDRYVQALKNDFFEFCDELFKNEDDIKQYCQNKNIPYDES